jgi:UDP:flavonoid glycosyltransferase YjiC (YdhE family)
MRVLFAFVGGQGHFDPLVPLARAASRAGHAITLASRPSMVPVVEARGFTAIALGPDVTEPNTITPLLAYDAAREERVLHDGFARHTALHRAEDLIHVCEGGRPDLIVADEVDYGALIAAERVGVPYATVIVLAAGGFARGDVLVEPINEVRAHLGLDLDPELRMLERHLVLAPEPPTFRDPAFPLGPRTLWLRPAVLEVEMVANATPWAVDPVGRPRVYVTLGTIFNMESGDLFARLLEAVSGLDAEVLFTVGRHLELSDLGAVPPHVRLESFVPQQSVLAGADLVISHGGSGTVIGALAFGVPQIVLPMGGDQPHNARRCEALGVGRALDSVHATAREIGTAVEEVLADRSYRQRSEVIRREAAQLPPAARGVEALEQLAAGA